MECGLSSSVFIIILKLATHHIKVTNILYSNFKRKAGIQAHHLGPAENGCGGPDNVNVNVLDCVCVCLLSADLILIHKLGVSLR